MRKLALGLATAAAVATGSIAAAPAAAEVYVYRPGPVYVHRAPVRAYYYARPFYWRRAYVAGHCHARVTRVWADGQVITRRVRRCY